MADPCIAANQAFIDYYETQRIGNTKCNLDNQKLDDRAEYCSTCIPQYDSLLSKASTACGENFDASIKHNYDFVKFSKHYLCQKDSKTDEYCDVVYKKGFNYTIPYSEWDSSLCSSSCAAEIDKGIREVSQNSDFLKTYNIDSALFNANSNNTIDSCTKKIGEEKTSGGKAISANICLLSLIICLIMAYLK
ncbi:hypothetical protein BCR36DRAFT_414784 [Piromyces finnis]|uniref:Uncharacterized protein n=1 Tax=Piromyces finnis TaxID=1754191 RepID=A0A1Y1V130_9FUNG|nr:hypothetical protein BCR36DRAFT_414784 [Piromyces finnis]|eukprot:ORX44812.1 hypothetical protein BCR36DRAFT_414784 [Piromyces finnis]